MKLNVKVMGDFLVKFIFGLFPEKFRVFSFFGEFVYFWTFPGKNQSFLFFQLLPFAFGVFVYFRTFSGKMILFNFTMNYSIFFARFFMGLKTDFTFFFTAVKKTVKENFSVTIFFTSEENSEGKFFCHYFLHCHRHFVKKWLWSHWDLNPGLLRERSGRCQ